MSDFWIRHCYRPTYFWIKSFEGRNKMLKKLKNALLHLMNFLNVMWIKILTGVKIGMKFGAKTGD